jgi:sugar lactone lactonase YvrE
LLLGLLLVCTAATSTPAPNPPIYRLDQLGDAGVPQLNNEQAWWAFKIITNPYWARRLAHLWFTPVRRKIAVIGPFYPPVTIFYDNGADPPNGNGLYDIVGANCGVSFVLKPTKGLDGPLDQLHVPCYDDPLRQEDSHFPVSPIPPDASPVVTSGLLSALRGMTTSAVSPDFSLPSCTKILGLKNTAYAPLPQSPTGQYLYVGRLFQTQDDKGITYDTGSLNVYASNQTRPLRTIDNGGVRALAFDKFGHLYAAQQGDCRGNGPGQVMIYDAKTDRLLATITDGINAPRQLEFDSHGNLYVDNIKGNITVYPPGGTRLLRTISEGVGIPTNVAFDHAGDLYVVNEKPPAITVYAPGSTHVMRTIARPNWTPSDIAFDRQGNLYVSAGDTVTEFAVGTSRVRRVISGGMNFATALAIDGNGFLYAGDAQGNTTVYDLRSGRLLRTLDGEATLYAFDRKGNVYISTWRSVQVYTPGGATLLRTYDDQGTALAIHP